MSGCLPPIWTTEAVKVRLGRWPGTRRKVDGKAVAFFVLRVGGGGGARSDGRRLRFKRVPFLWLLKREFWDEKIGICEYPNSGKFL